MEKSEHLKTRDEDLIITAPDLHRLLASRTSSDSDGASERLIRLNSLYGKDAPRDHFTPTSASLKTSSATEFHSLGQETGFTNTSLIGSTDSARAVKGSNDDSPTDGRVTFQEDAVGGVAAHIPNDSSDELDRRGQEVRIFGVVLS